MRQGTPAGAIFKHLLALNETAKPPLEEGEVRAIAESVERYCRA